MLGIRERSRRRVFTRMQIKFMERKTSVHRLSEQAIKAVFAAMHLSAGPDIP